MTKRKYASRRFVIAVFCMVMIALQLLPQTKTLPKVLNIGFITYLVIYAGYTTAEKIIMFIMDIKAKHLNKEA